MRVNSTYETNDGVVMVKQNYVKDEPTTVAYITIFAGTGKVHISARYLAEVADILNEIYVRQPHSSTGPNMSESAQEQGLPIPPALAELGAIRDAVRLTVKQRSLEESQL